MKLRFNKDQILELSNRYSYSSKVNILQMVDSIKEKKYLTKTEFSETCKWKTQRSKLKIESNKEDYVEEITKIALTTDNPQVSIEVLTLLSGVGWPTASTILHFFHKDKYPILDFRALYSLGFDKPPKYDYTFWNSYTEYCRNLSNSLKLDMRTIDKALWQYSNENQVRKKNLTKST